MVARETETVRGYGISFGSLEILQGSFGEPPILVVGGKSLNTT